MQHDRLVDDHQHPPPASMWTTNPINIGNRRHNSSQPCLLSLDLFPKHNLLSTTTPIILQALFSLPLLFQHMYGRMGRILFIVRERSLSFSVSARAYGPASIDSAYPAVLLLAFMRQEHRRYTQPSNWPPVCLFSKGCHSTHLFYGIVFGNHFFELFIFKRYLAT